MSAFVDYYAHLKVLCSRQTPIEVSRIWTCLGLILISLVVASVFRWKHDPREPPVIPPWIPFIGHIIGMVRYGTKYFEMINDADHPIFTLPVLGGQTYIIQSAHLAGLVQRNGKNLAFYPLILEVTRRLVAFDKETTRISKARGPGTLMEETHEMLNTVLAPGPDLDSMVAVQLQQTSQALNSTAVDGPVTLSLYPWVRHTLTLANAYAIYGPENIFARHPELERHFWDFEDGMLGIVLDLWPSITARKAYYARLKVLDGLHRYVLEKRYKNASVLIQRRIRTNLSYGLSKRMVGHGELILLFGILGNAVPTTFWVVANIFSRPALVKQLREELEDALELKYTAYDQKETVKAISANTVRTCPRLYSACRESLRTIANLTSARYVLSDTFLANKYFLRKGSVVQIASGSLHKDADIWGSDAETFNAERFLTDPLSHSQKREAAPVPKGVPSAAFRAFGGGNVLCPGRHFAQTEIMCFTALLLLSFEITDADGAPLKLPAKDDTRIPLSVMKPVGDPQIKIHRRDCSKNSRWVLTL